MIILLFLLIQSVLCRYKFYLECEELTCDLMDNFNTRLDDASENMTAITELGSKVDKCTKYTHENFSVDHLKPQIDYLLSNSKINNREDEITEWQRSYFENDLTGKRKKLYELETKFNDVLRKLEMQLSEIITFREDVNKMKKYRNSVVAIDEKVQTLTSQSDLYEFQDDNNGCFIEISKGITYINAKMDKNGNQQLKDLMRSVCNLKEQINNSKKSLGRMKTSGRDFRKKLSDIRARYQININLLSSMQKRISNIVIIGQNKKAPLI